MPGNSDTDVDDGPRYLYGNQATYKKQTDNTPSSLAIPLIKCSMVAFGANVNIGDQLHPSGKMDLET